MLKRAPQEAGTSASRASLKEDAPASAISARCILLGALSAALLGIVNPYLSFVFHTWDVGSGQLMNGPVLVLFILVIFNTLLVRLWPGRAFTRTELLVVYGMLTVSLGLLMQGGLPYLVALTTYPFYAATPENQWQHLIWPYIPLWFRVSSAAAVDWFWEGMPRGAAIPWHDWLQPVLAWGAFTCALMTAMFCLSALLSRDWIHRQRLTFPLVEVPLAVTGDRRWPTLGSSLLGNRVFWIGFAIPSVISTSSWLHRFWPNFPAPQLWGLDIGRTFAGMGLPWSALQDTHFSILFSVIGVMCLLPTEVALSLWLFYVLYKVQLLVWATFGVGQGGGPAFVDPRTFVMYQEAGAFIGFSVILLYESRQFIRKAWLGLWGGPREEDGPYAPLSGRAALLALIASVIFMLWFAVNAGMSWWSFSLLFGVFFTVLLGSTRLVAAAGVMYPDTGRYGYSFVINMLGSQPIGTPSLVIYTYFAFIYMQDPMNVAMPQMMNSFKLTDSGRIRGRPFSAAAAVAVVTVIVAGTAGLLNMLYHQGASQLERWPFFNWADWAFTDLSSSLRNPEAASNWLRLGVGVGAVVATALVLLHTYVVWWPVSPIGFLIASTYTSDWILWNNALVAWLLTSRIRRYGGLRLYRSFRPAFLGLILGDYLTSALFAILNTMLDYRRMLGG